MSHLSIILETLSLSTTTTCIWQTPQPDEQGSQQTTHNTPHTYRLCWRGLEDIFSTPSRSFHSKSVSTHVQWLIWFCPLKQVDSAEGAFTSHQLSVALLRQNIRSSNPEHTSTHHTIVVRLLSPLEQVDSADGHLHHICTVLRRISFRFCRDPSIWLGITLYNEPVWCQCVQVLRPWSGSI